MAKTFKYWVIVAGNTPTAFRSREKDALIPTLKQLQRTQPNVTLNWFERDRLWTSPEQAEEDAEQRRRLRRERGATWRPGGQHKDPKARVELTRDQKRAKFKRRLGFKSKDGDDLVEKPNTKRFGHRRSGPAGPRWGRRPGGPSGRSRGPK